MTGIEYEVLHVQDPILYVIRKQHRISPTQGQLQQIIFSVDYFDLHEENKIILTGMQLLLNPVVYRNTTGEESQQAGSRPVYCVQVQLRS